MGAGMTARPSPGPAPATTTIHPVRAVLGMAALILLPFFILLTAAGSLDWPAAWFYAGLTVGMTAISRLLIWRRNPDLLRERAQSLEKADTKSWDRNLVILIAIVIPLFLVLVAGLDHCNGWSNPVSPAVQIAAAVVMVLGYLFSTWAMVENAFFSGTVRIQKERGHRVVTTGPYRFVRHPGYSGALFVYLSAPLLLNTLRVLIPVMAWIAVMVYRTALEDRTLHAELDSYPAYAARVRYRLIPGLR